MTRCTCQLFAKTSFRLLTIAGIASSIMLNGGCSKNKTMTPEETLIGKWEPEETFLRARAEERFANRKMETAERERWVEKEIQNLHFRLEFNEDQSLVSIRGNDQIPGSWEIVESDGDHLEVMVSNGSQSDTAAIEVLSKDQILLNMSGSKMKMNRVK